MTDPLKAYKGKEVDPVVLYYKKDTTTEDCYAYDPDNIDTEPRMAMAIKIINSDYGDNVSVSQKKKTLLKFGRNDDLSTDEETVWLQGGIETLPTDNVIDTISSSSNSDTQEVVIEGHTISGSNLSFVSQTITLTGQTKATLATSLYRSTRLYNNGATDFVGNVYVYEDSTVVAGVPQTATTIHLKADTGNQSLKCSTALSSQDYWIITQFIIGVNRQQSRSVDFSLQVREYGKVFRNRITASAHSSGGTSVINLDPYIIVKKNSDVRVNAISSGASTGCSASINGYLAKVVT